MTVKYIKQDIAQLKAPFMIAHGVNCQRAMSSGVAKALYEKYPAVREEYLESKQTLGNVEQVVISKNRIVLNCWTQYYYGNDGKVYADMWAIKRAIGRAMILAKEQSLPLYMPKIGCGLAGLSWEKDVSLVVEELSATLGVDVVVCEL